MGHQGSARGHGGGIISASGAELESSAPDLVEQRQNCSAGVTELPAERHSTAARGDDYPGS